MDCKDDIAQLLQKLQTQMPDGDTQQQFAELSELFRTHQFDSKYLELTQEIEKVCRGIGHNFNGILATIRGTAEIAQLKNPDLPESATKAFDSIVGMVERGQRSTELVRNYGKAFNPHRDDIELALALQRIVNDLRMSLDIQIPFEFRHDCEPNVSINLYMLETAMDIMMKNALFAIAELAPDAPRLWLALEEDKNNANQFIITFGNNGAVIPDDVLPKIYDAFFTTKKASEGIGLGLTVVREFVEQHKGSIQVRSNDVEGTIFELRLPG